MTLTDRGTVIKRLLSNGQSINFDLIGRGSSYLEDVHIVLQLLQLLHPLLDDVLDFRLSDHQDFLPRQHGPKRLVDRLDIGLLSDILQNPLGRFV